VSQFLEEPGEDHMAVVKRIVIYAIGTYDWGLRFRRGKGKEVVLTCFSDSDFTGDVDQRYSTTGVIFLLADSPVS
jgi:hypothetical protein